MRIVLDLEANGLKPTKIWVVCCKDIDTGIYYSFREKEAFLKFATNVDLWIGHHILGFDLPVLYYLWDFPIIDISKVRDTFILSKLIDFPRDGHSIEDYGLEFNLPKGDFSDWSKYSKEMEEYCVRDVDICHKIYLKYLKYLSNPLHQPSILLEHKFQLIVNELHANGFSFNTSKAEGLLAKVRGELDGLDKEISQAFKDRLRPIREITPKYTQHGTLHRGDFRWVIGGDLSGFNGGPFTRCEWITFNPSSHKQIVDTLHEAGWSPTDKTKTHIECERSINRLTSQRQRTSEEDTRLKSFSDKREGLRKYGWRINEQNISSLPSKEQCRIKTENEETNIIAGTIKPLQERLRKTHGEENTTERTKNLEIRSKSGPLNVILKIQDVLKTNNSEEITEFLLKILRRCLKNKVDCANFVNKEKDLWSIIVTPQDVFVDFSASSAMETLDGMNSLVPERKIILTNLEKFYHSAPKAARILAKRILLESRRRTLVEWLGLVHPDTGRIHGDFIGIGAWTHRMAHQKPNTANIPNNVNGIGKPVLYGKEMRSLWQAPPGRLLVGVDAEGIQLRIFAHYIDDPEFTDSLVHGKKEDKSDPHNLNKRILGSVCKNRESAKRFIFALLLGAGIGKLEEILECSRDEAERALGRLMERYQGFTRLKKEVIPADAKRGWFTGLDGRRVRIPGETVGERKHLCMSGYLQNGEAIVLKEATCKWHPRLKLKYPDLKLVNFVHDEWQTEVPDDMAIALDVARTKADSLRETGIQLKLRCPLSGSYGTEGKYTIGTNWYQTH